MKIEKINPSIKVGSTLICVILLSMQYSVILNSSVFLLSILLLLFCSQADRKRLGKLLVPALITAFGLFVTGLFHGREAAVQMETVSTVPFAVRAAMSANLQGAMQLSTRLLAYAGFGLLFALTTDGEQFLSSLIHQCKLPPKFAYGILAAIHLMPNLVREFKSVRLAYRVRGASIHWYSLQPIFTMLVNAIRWSETVAMAMESKGFCGEADRTYYTVPKLHWYDWLYCGVWVIGMFLALVLLA